MKKINIIGLLLIATLIVSCDSILDKGPLDTFTNENFWTSEKNVEGYANGFYNDISGYASDFYYNTLSDDQAGGSFRDWTFTSIPSSSSNWDDNWEEVRRANILLEHVDGVSSMDADAKANWKGFARLMRGWFHYKLVRMYGDVPFINKSLDITDEGVLYGERTDRDIVMDSVLTDLDYACEKMKSSDSRITFSKEDAYAIKAEVCLYEGTFRKYRSAGDAQTAPDLTGSKKYLEACKDACMQLMNNSNYELSDVYQKNYNSVSLADNKEMILYKAYKQDVLTHSLIDYTCSSTQMSGLTKDAFDSYLFIDGKPLCCTTENTDDAAVMYTGTKIVAGKEVPDTALSLISILKVRDLRLSQTIDTALCYVSRGFIRFNVGMSMTSSTGYGVSKYDNEAIPVEYRNQGSSNYTDAPVFWLSEIYLEYAEACAELGTTTQNDLDISLNKLKARAGLPDMSVNVGFTDDANTIGVSDLIWEVRRERRCELMFDMNARYWDLIRWHQLDKLDSNVNPNILTGANIVNDPYNQDIARNGNYIDGSKGKTRTYDVKYYLYPIPSGQISLNPQLGQNPGWN